MNKSLGTFNLREKHTLCLEINEMKWGETSFKEILFAHSICVYIALLRSLSRGWKNEHSIDGTKEADPPSCKEEKETEDLFSRGANLLSAASLSMFKVYAILMKFRHKSSLKLHAIYRAQGCASKRKALQQETSRSHLS